MKESCLHLVFVCTAASNGLQACLISLSLDVFIVDLCPLNMKVFDYDKSGWEPFLMASCTVHFRGGSLLLDCIIMSPDPHSIFVLYDSLTPGR